MDIHKALELSKLADHQIALSQEYAEEREKAGKAKCDLEIMLTAKLGEIRKSKPNVGYDLAILMLIEIDFEAKFIYQDMCLATSRYKGLEKLIEAHQSKISLEQSIMKYIGQGEKFG